MNMIAPGGPMNSVATRRRVLQWMACSLPMFWLSQAQATASTPERIVSMSWELTETLLALGRVPVGMSMPDWYRKTIVEPVLPDGVPSTGLLYQPSFEALRALNPDLLLLTPGHAGLLPALSHFAPALILGAYMFDPKPYQALQVETRKMADALGCSPQAEALIASTEDVIGGVRQRLALQPPLMSSPTFVADAVDERYLRVYGAGSLFDEMLQQLGASNAAHLTGSGEGRWATNGAGFALVPLQRLATYPDVNLLLMGPVPDAVRAALQGNPVWQAIPAVRQRRVAVMPVICPQGGLISMQRFVRAVEQALVQTSRREPAFV